MKFWDAVKDAITRSRERDENFRMRLIEALSLKPGERYIIVMDKNAMSRAAAMCLSEGLRSKWGIECFLVRLNGCPRDAIRFIGAER